MIWLTSLPAWALVVGCLGSAVLVAIASRFGMRAFIPVAEKDNAFSISAAIMTAIAAVFAVTMALTLANEATYLVSAQGTVNNEAADASRLAWAATSPKVDGAPIHAALLRYLKATRANEWHGANAANGSDSGHSRRYCPLGAHRQSTGQQRGARYTIFHRTTCFARRPHH